MISNPQWPLGAVLNYSRSKYRDNSDIGVEEALDWLAEMGVKQVQVYIANLEPRDLHHAADLIAARGMLFESIHAPFKDGTSALAEPNPDKRSGVLERLRRTFDIAAELGLSAVIVHASGADIAPALFEDHWNRAVAGVRELATYAADKGVRLVVENLPDGYLPARADDLLRFLDELGDIRVSAAFDSGHAHLVSGDAANYFRVVSARVTHTHLHDNDGVEDLHIGPGEGQTDWEALVASMRSAEYAGAFTLEWHGLYTRAGRAQTGAICERLRALGVSV